MGTIEKIIVFPSFWKSFTKTLYFLELRSVIVIYMTEINFQPVFDYINKTFDQVLEVKLRFEFEKFRKEILTEVRAELREMKDQIANMVSEQKRFNDELQVSRNRVGRLEGWAEPVGRKLNIPFQY